jgi:hypothetical protein
LGSQQKKKKRTKDTRSHDAEMKRAQDLDQNKLAIHSNIETGYAPLGIGTISFVDVSTSMGSTQTGAPAPPPQVTGVTASPKAGSDTQIVINWSAASTATSYNVYVSTQTGFTPGPANLVTNTAALTYTATGLISGTTYYVKVAALNAVGTGTASAQASTTTTGTAPPPPTLTYRFKLPFEETLNAVPTAQIAASAYAVVYGDGGKFGHADLGLNTSGDSNHFIDLIDNSSPEVLLPIPWASGATVSFWIYPYFLSNLTDERLIIAAAGGSAGATDTWYIYIKDSRVGVYCVRNSPTIAVARKVHQTVLVTNTWYHVAFTWDNAGVGDNKIKLYIDKVPDSGLNTPANGWMPSNTGEWSATVGYLSTKQDTTWFGGLIDELQKWDGTANQTQIDNLYAFNHPSGTSQPAQITGLTVTPQGGSDTQLNLAWTASGASGLINYNIYRSTINGFTEFGDLVATSATNSYNDTGKVQGTTYYYRVSAVNNVAEGPRSVQVSGTTTGTPPTLPQILFHWDNSLTDNSGFTPLPTPTTTGTAGYTTPGKFGAAAVDPNPLLMYSQVDRYNMAAAPSNFYTISIWIYPTDISSTGMRRCIAQKIDTIVGSLGAYTVNTGWDLSMTSGGTVRLSVRYIYPDLDELQASVGGFVVNQWQMVTGTIDLLNREVKIYRNATIGGSDTTSASQFPDPNALTDEKLYFGHMLNEPTNTLFVGSLDEFQFYTKILTSAQILNLYNTNAP